MTTRTPLVVVNGQTQQMPVGDTVPLASGGTGATTAGAAMNALGATRTLTVSAPLTGGGNLSADRTLGLSYDTTLTVSGGALGVSSLVALASHTHTPAAIGAEPALGSPGTSGYVLSSTSGGVRSWAPQGAFSGILASSQGGTGVNNGSFTLTIPATGTAALLNVAQTFSATNTFSQINATIGIWDTRTITLDNTAVGATKGYIGQFASSLYLRNNVYYGTVGGTAANYVGNTAYSTAQVTLETSTSASRIYFDTGAVNTIPTTRMYVDSTGIFVVGGLNVGSATGAGAGEVKASGCVLIADGITAPSATSGYATLYVDSADGDLKIKFGDGVTKTIMTDT